MLDGKQSGPVNCGALCLRASTPQRMVKAQVLHGAPVVAADDEPGDRKRGAGWHRDAYGVRQHLPRSGWVDHDSPGAGAIVFPTPGMIRRIVGTLEDLGIVLTRRKNAGRGDHTLWYAIDEMALGDMFNLNTSMCSKWTDHGLPKMDTSSLYKNNTITTEGGVQRIFCLSWRDRMPKSLSANSTEPEDLYEGKCSRLNDGG